MNMALVKCRDVLRNGLAFLIIWSGSRDKMPWNSDWMEK